MTFLARLCGRSALFLVGLATSLPAGPPDPQTQSVDSDGPVTPNMFQGSDSRRINQAIAHAAETGRPVVIPRRNRTADGVREVWLLDSAILVRSGTVLELVNCHLKLSDRCRDNFIRSANCGLGITEVEPLENIQIRGTGHVILEGADHPRSTGDSGKTLGARTYGTDAGKPDVSPTGDWRNVGVLLAHVDGFRIENLHIKEAHGWAISLERCAHGTIRDARFTSTGHREIDGKREVVLNQDGIDLRQGCHDILIENISGHTGDDLIALTNLVNEDQEAGGTSSMMVTRANNSGQGHDDIRNITIRDVRGFSHGDHIIRFLNNRGLKIHDVILDGVIDTSTDQSVKAAVKIGDDSYGGHAPLGDTYHLMINNIISGCRHTILIAGTLSESILSNVIAHGDSTAPITYASGKENVRDLVISNVKLLGEGKPAGSP